MDHLGIALRRIRLRLSPRQIVVCFRGTTFLSFSQTTAVRFLRSARAPLPSISSLKFFGTLEKEIAASKDTFVFNFSRYPLFFSKMANSKRKYQQEGDVSRQGGGRSDNKGRVTSTSREKSAHLAVKKWVVNSRRWSHATRAASLFLPSLSLATLLLARHREESRLSFSLFSSFSSFLLFSTDHRRPSSSRPRVGPRPTPISIARARLGLWWPIYYHGQLVQFRFMDNR